MNEEINEGDLVICVNDKHFTLCPPLKKGNKYVINSISSCVCGAIGIDVGNFKLATYQNKEVVCNTCGKDMPITKIALYHPSRFCKLPPPAKEIRIVEIAYDLREEVRELVNDVLVKERRDV